MSLLFGEIPLVANAAPRIAIGCQAEEALRDWPEQRGDTCALLPSSSLVPAHVSEVKAVSEVWTLATSKVCTL
ncbi:hypothetical protein MHYP_G00224770 [Metynnis hypsauchen]